jgi:hypothetical protein
MFVPGLIEFSVDISLTGQASATARQPFFTRKPQNELRPVN